MNWIMSSRVMLEYSNMPEAAALYCSFWLFRTSIIKIYSMVNKEMTRNIFHRKTIQANRMSIKFMGRKERFFNLL